MANLDKVVAVWKNSSKTKRPFSHSFTFLTRSSGGFIMYTCRPYPFGISAQERSVKQSATAGLGGNCSPHSQIMAQAFEKT